MTNKVALELIKRYEGCELLAYRDMVGVWTIGWGHTGPDVKEGLRWSQMEADESLAEEIDKIEAAVVKRLNVPMTEGQKGAIISFVYNLGEGSIADTGMGRLLRQKDWMKAAKEFQRWDNAGGKPVRGLLIRRFDEALTFIKASG